MKKRILLFAGLCAFISLPFRLCADGSPAGGLGVSLDNIYRLENVETRSISPENFTGEKGHAGMATNGTGKGASRELGQGWKVSPSINIKAKSTFTLAEINGPGSIRGIWMTPTGNWRTSVLRFYWDDETEPSVEVPVGDFFAMRLGQVDRCPLIDSAANLRQSRRCAFNCYWPMPFRKKPSITMENLADDKMVLYYQINYTLGKVPRRCRLFPCPVPARESVANQGNLHHPRRRRRQRPIRRHLPGLRHARHRVGGARAKSNSSSTATRRFPTICGTGTEDYFCGSYDFEGTTAGRQDAVTPNLHPSLFRLGPGHPTGRIKYDVRNSVLAFIAGISPTRSVSTRFQSHHPGPSAGNPAADTCRCRMTSLRWPSGIKPSRTKNSPKFPTRDELEFH